MKELAEQKSSQKQTTQLNKQLHVPVLTQRRRRHRVDAAQTRRPGKILIPLLCSEPTQRAMTNTERHRGIHTHTHAHTRTHARTHVHTHIHTDTHTHTHKSTCTHMDIQYNSEPAQARRGQVINDRSAEKTNVAASGRFA